MSARIHSCLPPGLTSTVTRASATTVVNHHLTVRHRLLLRFHGRHVSSVLAIDPAILLHFIHSREKEPNLDPSQPLRGPPTGHVLLLNDNHSELASEALIDLQNVILRCLQGHIRLCAAERG